jgi:glycosyltransferase involved in cell wall biosynthesis
MRIGFISTHPPVECGIATYTQELNKALRTSRVESFIISAVGAEGEGVFPIFRPEAGAFAADVYATSLRLTPDIMHIQHEFGLYGPQRGVEILGLLTRYRLAGLPVVCTLHTAPPQPDETEAIILGQILAQSQAIIVHEAIQREHLIRRFGHGKKIHVIEHGVRQVAPIRDAKARLGLDGRKIILLSGYFRPSKGFHRIVDLFPTIAAHAEDAVLVVAGKARNIEFADYQRELYAQIEACPYVRRILVLRGQFPQHTFDTIMSAADVVALPYERGAQSGILSQCFALERPVVVSDLPAFEELVTRSGVGLVCHTDRDYVENIIKLLNDEVLSRQCQTNIRRYVQGRASWRLIARRHMEVYEEIIFERYGNGRFVYFPESEDGQAAGRGRTPTPSLSAG